MGAKTAILLCLLLSDGRAAWGQPFEHPGGLTSRARLEAVRGRLRREPWKSAFARLREEALGALGTAPGAPASLNVPGYYLDPAGHERAKKPLSEAGAAAYVLTLAYRLEPGPDRGRFAAKAAELLDAWAAGNRRAEGADGDLVLCYAGLPLLFAAELLQDGDGWDAARREAFRAWVRAVFLRSADRLKRRGNNQGAWGLFASMAARHLLDDREGLREDVSRLRRRLDEEIAPDGTLPAENRRTNSGIWYTYFALAPLTGAASIALESFGDDLFHRESRDGKGLRRALDVFFGYCVEPARWPYRRPRGLFGWFYNRLYPSAERVLLPSPGDWPDNLFEAMSAVYGEPRWEAFVAPRRPIRGGRAWIYPVLLGLPAAPGQPPGRRAQSWKYVPK